MSGECVTLPPGRYIVGWPSTECTRCGNDDGNRPQCQTDRMILLRCGACSWWFTVWLGRSR